MGESAERDRIRAGIACYADMQAEIIEAIREAGGELSQTRFDHLFGDYELVTDERGDTLMVPKPPRLGAVTFDQKSFILGGLYCHSSQQKYLDLAQLMCAAGLLAAVDRGGLVVYLEADDDG